MEETAGVVGGFVEVKGEEGHQCSFNRVKSRGHGGGGGG